MLIIVSLTINLFSKVIKFSGKTITIDEIAFTSLISKLITTGSFNYTPPTSLRHFLH